MEIEKVLTTPPIVFQDHGNQKRFLLHLFPVSKSRLFFSQSEDNPAYMLIRGANEFILEKEKFSNFRSAEALSEAILVGMAYGVTRDGVTNNLFFIPKNKLFVTLRYESSVVHEGVLTERI